MLSKEKTGLIDFYKSPSENSQKRLVLIYGFLLSLVLYYYSITRHYFFDSASFDLGIFSNTIWNLVNGNGYVTSIKGGINLFQDHQSPILWVIAPLFKIFPFIETLLFIQALFLGMSTYPLYLLLKKEDAPYPLLLVFLASFIYLPLRNANYFEFHPLSLSILPFLFGIYFFEGKRHFMGIVFFIISILCKESVPLAVLCYCASLFVSKKTDLKWIFLLSIIALVFFTGMVFTPKIFFEGSYTYSNRFEHMLDLKAFFKYFLSQSDINYFFWTIGGLAFIPLLSTKAFLAPLGMLLILTLSRNEHSLLSKFHHGLTIAPLAYYAFVKGVKKISIKKWAATILITSMAFSGNSEFFRTRMNKENNHHKWLRQNLIPNLEKDIAISSTGHIVPHLFDRKWVHHLPKIEKKNGDHVECIIYDSSLNNWPIRSLKKQKDLLLQLENLKYQKEYSCGPVIIFSRDKSNRCLSKKPICHGQDFPRHWSTKVP